MRPYPVRGRFRYGTTGRWLNVTGEAFFSPATPGFVWHTTIAYTPGIWIDAFDYYVHREAGIHRNLFSVLPPGNAYGDATKPLAPLRYLASTRLFPMALRPGLSLEWKNMSDSTAQVSFKDDDLCAGAVVRFDGAGRIRRIEACSGNRTRTGRPVPGHCVATFSGYTEVQGYKIPLQISSDLMLPGGEYASSDVRITGIEFEHPKKLFPAGA